MSGEQEQHESATVAADRFPTYDPEIAAFVGSSGGEDGGLPGFLGLRTVEVGPGTMTAELDVRDDLLNPFGVAHGGVVSAMVDHVLGAVLYPLIPRGAWAATTEFKLNLLAPVREGAVQARSEVIALTKRTAVVRIDVTCDGGLVGAAQGTVTIRPPAPPTEE